jgi:hypothetical protein
MGTLREAEKYREMLDLYCNATGMEVNINKSNIIFNNVANIVSRNILTTVCKEI